jgi:TonB family protein
MLQPADAGYVPGVHTHCGAPRSPEQRVMEMNEAKLRTWLEQNIKNKVSPEETKLGGKEVTMSFALKLDGEVENLKIDHSSGSKEIDEKALTALKKAIPFPTIPNKNWPYQRRVSIVVGRDDSVLATLELVEPLLAK